MVVINSKMACTQCTLLISRMCIIDINNCIIHHKEPVKYWADLLTDLIREQEMMHEVRGQGLADSIHAV
jgi:hypothetical protein